MGKILDNSNDDDDDDEGGDGEGDEDKTFSQEAVDRMVAKARSQARRSAERKLLDELEVEDIEEAKRAVTKGKAEPKPPKETGKNSKDGDKDDSSSEAVADLARQFEEFKLSTNGNIAELKITSKVEKALIKEGMSVAEAEKARRLVEVPNNADEDEIEDAIDDLKETMPSLFDSGSKSGGDDDEDDDDDDDGKRRKPKNRDRDRDRDDRRRNPGSNPGGSPRRRKSGGDTRSDARTLLHERHPRLKKDD